MNVKGTNKMIFLILSELNIILYYNYNILNVYFISTFLVVDLEAERLEGKVQVEINLLVPDWLQASLHTPGLVE